MKIDLTKSLDEIKSGCSKNWRHNLNRSFKKDTLITRWDNVNAQELKRLYEEFESSKGIGEQYSLELLTSILNNLDQNFIIFKAENSEGKILGIRACAYFNEKAWDLMAITTKEGQKFYSSHRLLWSLLEECKKLNIKEFDFSGINPENNKDVYSFKRGTGAEHITYLGEWDYSNTFGLKTLFNYALKKKEMNI